MKKLTDEQLKGAIEKAYEEFYVGIEEEYGLEIPTSKIREDVQDSWYNVVEESEFYMTEDEVYETYKEHAESVKSETLERLQAEEDESDGGGRAYDLDDEDIILNDGGAVIRVMGYKKGEYAAFYPYRYDRDYQCYINCSGQHDKQKFKELLNKGKLSLR